MSSSGDISPASITPASTPLSINAPKYGITIRNRIFVGGIPAGTSEQELRSFFASRGSVKDVKIITDRAGVSKGYGFVTFETQEDAEKILKEADNFVFKDRKLNLGVAVRKQVADNAAIPVICANGGVPMGSGGTILLANGMTYSYQNGMAFFQASPEAAYSLPSHSQTAAAYPLMMPTGQPYYLPQTYAYPAATALSPAQQWSTAASPQQAWRWAAPAGLAPMNGQYSLYPVQNVNADLMYATQSTACQAGYGAGDMSDNTVLDNSQTEFCYGTQYSINSALC